MIVMRRTRVAATLMATVLVSATANAGPGQGETQHEHAPAPSEASSQAGDGFAGTIIERRLAEGPAETIVVAQGSAIRLVLHAPGGSELHLHGYDLHGTARAGLPVILTFEAVHLGRFPIEAHGLTDVLGRTGRVLAYLEVRRE